MKRFAGVAAVVVVFTGEGKAGNWRLNDSTACS